MTPLKKILTEDQVKDMRKLVDFLLYDETVTDKNFSMEHIGRRNEKFPSCSIGWGRKVIGPKLFCKINPELSGTNTFRWMYHSGWSEVDNTKEGAAGRILYALEVGTPRPNKHLFTEDWYTNYVVKPGYKYPKRLQNWLDKVRNIK